MSYYDTIEEDIARAKEILARGIYGGDTHAVHKLLESFVPQVERVQELEAENARFRDELATPLGRMLAREKEKVQELERKLRALSKSSLDDRAANAYEHAADMVGGNE